MLTNNTEIINMTNRLGHGICYSLLEEMETENAYKVIDEQTEGVIIPKECKKNVLTVLVADNIDRKEETLSGKSNIVNLVYYYYRCSMIYSLCKFQHEHVYLIKSGL